MEQHVGIDVSLKLSSVCIVDTSGKIVRETKVASEPEALIAFFKGLSVPVTRIGLEALSQWLHAELLRAGFEAVLLETRHVKAALSAMSTKTDRNDARHCPAYANGLVPSRTRQIGRLARGTSVARRAQAAAFERGVQPTLQRSRRRDDGSGEAVSFAVATSSDEPRAIRWAHRLL
jgi:transposase